MTSISPLAGPLAGGTSITITGTGLANASKVEFGGDDFGDQGVYGTITYNTDTQIVVTVPASQGAGPTDVQVETVGGTSLTSPADLFTYEDAPSVSGVSPSPGNSSGGDIVTITGTNLDGATRVNFGDHAGTIIYASEDSIQAVSPADAPGSVNVTVIASGGTSATSSADQFIYVGAPSAAADSYSVTAGSTLTVDAAYGVLANDTDPQSDLLNRGLARQHHQWNIVVGHRWLVHLHSQ